MTTLTDTGADRLAGALDRLTGAIAPRETRVGRRSEPGRTTLTDLGQSSRRFPGFLGLFEAAVPPEYFERRGELVLIVCHCRRGPIAVMTGGLAECRCGRWFLAGEDVIRACGPFVD